MEFSMNSKEKAKANDLGATVVLIGRMGQYIAGFDEKCTICLPKQITTLVMKERSQDFAYKNIRAVSHKDGGILMPGWLQLDTGGGTKSIVTIDTPGVCLFGKGGNKLSGQIRSFLDEKISEFSNVSQKVIQESSSADELKKYADLKEQGIITEEEFNAKKKEILGL